MGRKARIAPTDDTNGTIETSKVCVGEVDGLTDCAIREQGLVHNAH